VESVRILYYIEGLMERHTGLFYAHYVTSALFYQYTLTVWI
jgi:hypothetical protein